MPPTNLHNLYRAEWRHMSIHRKCNHDNFSAACRLESILGHILYQPHSWTKHLCQSTWRGTKLNHDYRSHGDPDGHLRNSHCITPGLSCPRNNTRLWEVLRCAACKQSLRPASDRIAY